MHHLFTSPVAIKNHLGTFISAQLATEEVSISPTNSSNNELFQVAYIEPNKIAFKVKNGKLFLRVEESGTLTLSPECGASEQFTTVVVGPTQVGLLTAHNLFLSVSHDGKLALSKYCNLWEHFELI